MSRQVRKHVLTATEAPQTITLRGAEAGIVHFAVGLEGFNVWTEEEPDSPVEQTRTVMVIRFSRDVPDGFVHLRTVLGCPEVWHLYEVAS